MKRRNAVTRKLARRGRAAGLGLALLSGFAASAEAQQVSDSWISTTGNYSSAGSWSLNTVPNNGGGTTYNVLITAAGSAVTLDTSPTIDNLTIAGGNSLTYNPGQILTINFSTTAGSTAGSISNAGTITLGGSGAELRTVGGGTMTLSGGGSVVLAGDGNNLIRDPSASTGKLVNVDNTISGVGNIGSAQLFLDNQAAGTVSANISGKTLTIQPNGAGASNEGLMQASSGGTLQFLNAGVTNTGGTIKANTTSTVQINNSSVTGGTLASAGSGTIQVIGGGTTFGSLTNSSANLQVNAGQILNLANGMTLTNTGTLTLEGSAAELRTAGNGTATLSGGGTVFLGGDGNNLIRDASSSNGSITNANNTIHGVGNIGSGQLSFDNQASGTITADVIGKTLTLAPNGTGFKNEGLMQASSGGTLLLLNGGFTNSAAGVVQANVGSTVTVSGSSVSGGTLASSGTGVVQLTGNSTLGSISLSGANVQIAAGNDINLANGMTLTNTGTLTLEGSAAELRTVGGGTATLTGGGTIVMGGDGNNLIRDPSSSNGKITNVNNTIEGAGLIGNTQLSLDNQASGTITANVNGKTLTLQPNGNGFSNEGLMQASSGGTLVLNGGFTNTGGTIQANTGSTVEVTGSSLSGGTLASSGTGVVVLTGNSTLGSISLSGANVQIAAGNDINLANGMTLTNTGTLTLEGADAELRTVGGGTATLTGGGTIVMSGDGNNTIRDPYSSTGKITNVNNTIEGAGNIGNGQLTFDNQAGGTITANVSGKTLALQPNSAGFSNEGLMQASSGGTLVLLNGVFTNSAAGVVQANAGSTVTVSGSSVSGGTLASVGSGIVQLTGGSALGSISLSGANVQIAAGQFLNLANGMTLTNTGTLTLEGSDAELRTVGGGTATLSGGGTIVMSGDGNNTIRDASASTGKITNVNNTIEGVGNIGSGQLAFDNQAAGTILANISGRTLAIQPNGAGFSNEGTLRANSGSLLQVTGGPFTNFSGSTLTGGTYEAFSGTIQFNGANIATNAATIVLDGATSKIIDESGNDALRNFATNTAAGSFTIQDGRNLTTPGDFGNAGAMHVAASSTLTVGSTGTNSYNQTAGTTEVDGTLHASLTTIAGGTLSGSGTVQGNVNNSGGTVMPGTLGTAGVLTITGNYTDPSASILDIQIGGPDSLHGLSQLDVNGTANLNNGTLELSLINGFTPTNGELFTILTADSLSGTFSNNTIVDGNVTFQVEYGPPGFANDVVLEATVNQPVPEPASVVLVGVGGIALLAYRRHRRRAGV